MLRDIQTVMWKEVRELPRAYGGGRKGWLFPVFMLGIFGVWFPLSFGRMWMEKGFVVGFAPMISLSFLLGLVPDAFAGERERHTLETLLASRLSDRGILFGKVATYVSVAWLLSPAMLLVGLVTANLANWGRGLVFYEPKTFLGALGASALVSGLGAGAGVLVSLRASTVKQAQQILIIGFYVGFGAIFGGVRLVMKFAGVRTKEFVQALERFGLQNIVLTGVGVLIALDVLFLLLAMARFKRARLILD